MEVHSKDVSKNKFKNKPLSEYEYLANNVFEGDGFQIVEFNFKDSVSYPKKKKKAERAEVDEWGST